MPIGDWYCPSCADENAEADANDADAMDVEWVAMRARLAEHNKLNANEFVLGVRVPFYKLTSELGPDGSTYELTATGVIVGIIDSEAGPVVGLNFPNEHCKQHVGVADLRKYIKAGLAKVSGMHPEHYIYILP